MYAFSQGENKKRSLLVDPFSDSNIANTLSSTLMGSSDMEESVVAEYEQAFVDIVDSSELDDNNKYCVKSVGSIAIRSNHYWYAGE